ncbi:hypothetical protein FI667_g1724, partial [Globisporangium splendens]
MQAPLSWQTTPSRSPQQQQRRVLGTHISDTMKAMAEQDSQEIRLCALVLSVVAFFLFIAAEIVHDSAYACRAVILLVATGALGFAWIGPLTLLAGTLRSKKFQWWQPFQGGVEFVWMQAFGWCLHTFVLTASVVVLANSQLPKWFEGQYLFLGVTGFIAQILLNLSIGCFREIDTEQPVFQLPLNAKTVVSLLVSASGLLLFVFYDLFSHLGQSPVVIAVGCVEFIASALVIHVFYGCADIPGYRIWQPFEGERMFLLLQYFGWQLFAFTIGGAMNVLCSADDMSGYGSSKGTTTAIGAMGMTSQILLLVSLQYFDKGSGSQKNKADSSDHAAQPTSLPPLSPITRKTKLPAEIYVTSMLCIGALAVGFLSYTSRAKIGVVPDKVEQFFLAHEKVGWIISLCSLAIAAPISNMGGVRSKPEYSWWQPFQGGTKFVFLQTLGWLWYGFYLALSIVLCMNSARFGELIGCFVLLVGTGSAGAIALSLSYFEPQELKKTKVRDSKQALYWCDATKGEVVMVVLLSMSSMLFHLLVDFFQDRMLPSIKALCVVLAMALFVLASTISHCSGRKLHARFRIWQPFEGGSRYVIHQAVGWSLFAIQLLFDSLLLSLVSQALPRGLSSLLGFFGLMPQILILISNQHFEPALQDQDDLKPSRPSLRIIRIPAHPQTWSSLLKTSALKWHAGSNLFVAIVSICLFASAEILGAKGVFHRSEEVLYIFGCLLSVYGILSVHCVLGPKLHSSYRVIQPFRGGIKFITFQGAAWTIVSVAWAVSITVIYWSSVFFRFRGIQLLTGLLYFVSQMLLLYSLPLFQAPKSHMKTIVRGKPKLQSEIRRKAEDLVNQYFVGRLLGFSACCVFVLVDFTMLHLGPSIPMFPATICAVLGLFSSIPLTYKFATSTYGPMAKSISGSIVFIVLGCALWSFTLLLGALFSYQLWSTQAIDRSMSRSENAPTQFMGTFTGSVGFMAQLLFFQASESSLLEQGSEGKVSSEENLVVVMTKLKKNLKCASIWVYSAITLVSGLVYAHTKSVIPKHLATTQVLGLVFCCVVVIWSAWCIQQQIISSGGGIAQYRKCSPVSQDRESDIVMKHIPILDIGLDCYAQLAAFLTVSEIVGMSATCKTAHAFHTDALWRRIFARRYGSSHMDHTFLKLESADTHGYGDTNENAITVRTKPFAATTLHRIETTVVNMICGLEFPTIQPAPPKSAIINM